MGHIVSVSGSNLLPKLFVKDIDLGRLLSRLRFVSSTSGLTVYLLEDTLGIKHAAVNLLGVDVASADEEYLCTLTSTGVGLDRLNLFG